MASFVIVVDTSARRLKIKTNPEKSLSEVLQEACTGWRYNSSLYTLKNNNKNLDLSRTIRLSGLSSGAKLELVKLSKTPSAISVALQLPENEREGIPNGRLTDKFATSSSLWQIIRRFESATAGGLGTQKNFTGRGVPSMVSGTSGAGRLYHEAPVLRIMGREYSSLTDLQKSLGQLGFTGGSVLLHLAFRTSEAPLEQAQKEIGDYFKSLEESGSGSQSAHSGAVGSEISVPNTSESIVADEDQESKSPQAKSPVEVLTPVPEDESSTVGEKEEARGLQILADTSQLEAVPLEARSGSQQNDGVAEQSTATFNGEKRKASSPLARESSPDSGATITRPSESISNPQPEPENTTSSTTSANALNVTGPDQRPISVYAPPASTTPKAANQPHNEQDYEPTIAQQQKYQAHLGKISQQQRLRSDHEIEAQQKAQVEKLDNIKEVEIKFRFPNQIQTVAKFNNLDTSATLYDHVKGLMDHEDEPFSLKYSSPKGPQLVPQDSTVRLISGLGMVGRVLVTVMWGEGASIEARTGFIIKAEFRKNAQEIEVKEIEGTVEDRPNLGWGRLGEGRSQGDGKSSGRMKFLKGLRKI